MNSILKQAAKSVLPDVVLRTARNIKLCLALAVWRSREVTHSFCGIPLRVYLGDPLAAGWYDHDWFECPEADFLSLLPKKSNGLFFDLGAHQAVVALMIQKLLGECWRGVAIEGNSMNVHFGRKNIALNNNPLITLVDAVVAAGNGYIDFNTEWNGSVASEGSIRATRKKQTISIDTLAAEYGQPDIIFIDIEGFEVEALKGANKTIERECAWFIEVHSGCGLELHAGSIEAVLNAFSSSDYICMYRAESLPGWVTVDMSVLPQSRFFFAALPKSMG